MRRSRIGPATLVLAVFAGLGLGVIVAVVRTEPFGVVLKDGEPDRLMDFASHRGFACATWSGDLVGDDASSIYTVAAHLKATERWTGMPARIALPFGYSPTMLWVLGPLCLVSQPTAFAAWTVAGMVALVLAVRRARVGWLALTALITPLAISVLGLGQTAVLTTAALVFLLSEDREEAARRSWTSAIVLWLLTAKPPLAVAAGAALVARRRWAVLLGAGLLTVVSTIVLIPWMGATWLHDYWSLLTHYDRASLPPAFAWSIAPHQMTNLRAALSVDLGLADGLASWTSGALWGAVLLGIVVAGWSRRTAGPVLWTISIMAFLLLCPHVSVTEDLALLCVVVGLERVGAPGRDRAVVLALVLTALVLTPVTGPVAGRRPPVAFFAKAILAGVAVASLIGRRTDDRRADAVRDASSLA